MIRQIKTIKDATTEWIKEFNAFPRTMIDTLMSANIDSWREITPPATGDRVYVFESALNGDILSVNTDNEDEIKYEVETDEGTVLTLSADDFEVETESDGSLPMWGTMWGFGETLDDNWLEEDGGLQIMADCGLRIYESDEWGYFFGIDGAGYDFYEEHWIPLYKARGLKWHDEEEKSKTRRGDYMATDIVEFKKGQVWHIQEEKGLKVRDTKLIKNSRYWVVISIERDYRYNPYVTMVPVTSKFSSNTISFKGDIVAHIKYDQIQTFDKDEILREGAIYKYTLTDVIVEKIDKKLSERLGLGAISSDVLKQVMEMVDEMVIAKVREIKAELTPEEFINQVNLKIGKAISNEDLKAEDIKIKDVKKEMNVIMKDVQKLNVPQGEFNLDSYRTPGGKIRWTTELIRLFLKDDKSFTEEEMMSKYEFPDKKSVYSARYRLRKKLESDEKSKKKGK